MQLWLAVHAKKARIVVADVGRAGRVIQVLALGATHLSLWTIVAVVALNENAGAGSPLGDIDAADARALGAASRGQALGFAACDMNTGARRVRVGAGQRSVIGPGFDD